MSVAAYTLVFQGKILDGFEPDSVKAQVARLFKLDPARLEEMFSAPRVVLKRNLAFDDADRFRDALHRMGLAVSLEPGTHAAPAAPQRTPAPAQAARPAPATQAASATADASTATKAVPFEFSGEGFEFFKIWIVNILLTIVTLGIYSAWAKVRTQRYFYGNTRLDGATFEYLAEPIRILKGRLIAFAFFLAYVLSDLVSPVLSLIFFLAFLVLLPWVMVRALRFRNHYSAWRGVRFGFDGRWGESARAFLLWPLAGLLTVGILIPLAMLRQQQFIIGNSRYGNAPLTFNATPGGFYKVFFILIVVLLGGVAAAGLFGAVSAASGATSLALATPIFLVATYLGVFLAFNVLMTNLRFKHTALTEHRFEANYHMGSYAKLMLGNTLGLILTLGLFYPWAKVRNARYAAAHIRLQAAGDLEGFAATQHEEMSAIGAEVGDLFDLDIGF